MSIEELIAANTAAIQANTKITGELIAQLEAGRHAPGPAKQEAPGKPLAADAAAPSPLKTSVSATASAGSAVTTSPSEITFETLRASFQKLAIKDRNKALAVLADHGVAKLSEAQPEQYASLAKALG